MLNATRRLASRLAEGIAVGAASTGLAWCFVALSAKLIALDAGGPWTPLAVVVAIAATLLLWPGLGGDSGVVARGILPDYRQKHLRWSREHHWNYSPNEVRPKRPASGPAFAAFFLVGVCSFIVGLAGLALQFAGRFAEPKPAFERTVLFFAMAFAFIYYAFRSDDFESTADRVTFFAGVIVTPPAIVNFAL